MRNRTSGILSPWGILRALGGGIALLCTFAILSYTALNPDMRGIGHYLHHAPTHTLPADIPHRCAGEDEVNFKDMATDIPWVCTTWDQDELPAAFTHLASFLSMRCGSGMVVIWSNGDPSSASGQCLRWVHRHIDRLH